jgi:hypothetical protein
LISDLVGYEIMNHLDPENLKLITVAFVRDFESCSMLA